MQGRGGIEAYLRLLSYTTLFILLFLSRVFRSMRFGLDVDTLSFVDLFFVIFLAFSFIMKLAD